VKPVTQTDRQTDTRTHSRRQEERMGKGERDVGYKQLHENER